MDFIPILLLVSPKALEVICMSKIDCDSDYICVFHRLSDLDIFVREHLNLLPIVPEGRIEAIQQDGRFRAIDILQRRVITLVAESYKYFLEVGGVVCL